MVAYLKLASWVPWKWSKSLWEVVGVCKPTLVKHFRPGLRLWTCVLCQGQAFQNILEIDLRVGVSFGIDAKNWPIPANENLDVLFRALLEIYWDVLDLKNIK